MGDCILPPLEVPVSDMTRDHLRKFIPSLICQTEGKNRFKIGVDNKPSWWPKDIPWYNLRTDTRTEELRNLMPWTEALREIVRKCYKYHGAEHMLKVVAQSPASPIQIINNVDGTVSFITEKTVLTLDQKAEDAVEGKTMEAVLPTPAKLFDNQAFRAVKSDTIVLNQLSVNYKEQYMKSLGLIPKASLQNEQLSNSVREKQPIVITIDDVDGENEEEEENDKQLKSPTTPRTPKSILYQLSRDLSPPGRNNRRKSLLFENHHEHQGENNNTVILATAEPTTSSWKEFYDKPVAKNLDGFDVVESGNIYACSKNFTKEEEGEESTESKDATTTAKHMKIMNIDVSSLLGARVLPLMQDKVEGSFNCVGDNRTVEDYCHTPKKNPSVLRLRHRPMSYPHVYNKKSRKVCPKNPHTYKFTKAERREWFRISLTGLNKRSRALKRATIKKKCFVTLMRLPEKEIKEWTKRKPEVYIDVSQLPNVSSSLFQSLLTGQIFTSPQGRQYIIPNSNSVHHQQRVLLPKLNNNDIVVHENNVIDLTPSSSPSLSYTFKSKFSSSPPRPVQMVANVDHHSKALESLMARPLQQRLAASSQTSRRGKSRSAGSNQQQHCVNSRSRNTRKRVEEEVICLSSEDSDSDSSKPPPRKKSKLSPSASGGKAAGPTLQFNCHLCHEKLVCTGNFSRYIEAHFSKAHSVNNIQLIEHIDNQGNKVVSIVEKKPQSLNTTSSSGKKNKSVAMKSTTKRRSATTLRQSKNGVALDDSDDVICID